MIGPFTLILMFWELGLKSLGPKLLAGVPIEAEQVLSQLLLLPLADLDANVLMRRP